jgi:hypothetical protein
LTLTWNLKFFNYLSVKINLDDIITEQRAWPPSKDKHNPKDLIENGGTFPLFPSPPSPPSLPSFPSPSPTYQVIISLTFPFYSLITGRFLYEMGVESEYFSLVLDGSLGVRAGINGWKSEVSTTYIHTYILTCMRQDRPSCLLHLLFSPFW